MSLNVRELMAKKTLTPFEKTYLADRNIDHPALGDDSGQTVDAPITDAAADPAGAQVPESFDSYDELTVSQLQFELKNRDLSAKGNKDELITRLEEDDRRAEV